MSVEGEGKEQVVQRLKSDSSEDVAKCCISKGPISQRQPKTIGNIAGGKKFLRRQVELGKAEDVAAHQARDYCA
jgi:hypothetical protein